MLRSMCGRSVRRSARVRERRVRRSAHARGRVMACKGPPRPGGLSGSDVGPRARRRLRGARCRSNPARCRLACLPCVLARQADSHFNNVHWHQQLNDWSLACVGWTVQAQPLGPVSLCAECRRRRSGDRWRGRKPSIGPSGAGASQALRRVLRPPCARWPGAW